MRATLLVCAVVLGACDDDGGDDTPVKDAEVTMRPPRPTDDWTIEAPIATDGAGLHADLAAGPGGVLGVAWFDTVPETGEACTEVGDSPPDKVFWTLRYAGRDGTAWSTEAAHRVLLLGAPLGLALAFDDEAVPHIATMTGEPLAMQKYCGANDLGLLRRRGEDDWALETVAVSSATAPAGDAASDFGEVVGPWPALAFDADGQPAVAYKDVHSGAIQGDDLTRADVAFAWQTGGWQHEVVDFGRGAGDYSVLAFDLDGRPVLTWHTPVEHPSESRRGVWVARRGADGAWAKVRLYEGSTVDGPDVVAHPDTGDLWVSYYEPVAKQPVIRRLAAGADLADADAWEREVVPTEGFDEGRHARRAVAPDGGLAAVWYRCAKATAGDCTPDDDAVVVGWRDEAGGWAREVVDAGDRGLCGTYPDLAFEADGRLRVIYQCSRARGASFEFQLETAVRRRR